MSVNVEPGFASFLTSQVASPWMVEERDPRVDKLEKRMERIEKRLGRIEGRLGGRAESSPAPEEREASRAEPSSTFAPVIPQPASAEPEPTESRSLEQMLGADVLAKAGIIVLVLGVAFFLKFAFDNDWIPLTGRIILGVVGGLALWGIADWLDRRDRYGAYPQVLAGGGAVILYFSLYVAYALDEYRAATGMTLELDAVLLGLVALSLAGYAAWRELPTLAGLSIVLGGITSLVAGPLDIFSVVYLVLLTAVVAIVAVYRRWAAVGLTALVASHAVLALDLAAGVEPLAVMISTGLLFALFIAVALRVEDEEAILLGGALPIVAGVLVAWGAVEAEFSLFAGLFPLALGAGGVLLALTRRDVRLALAAAAAGFALLAVDLSEAAGIPSEIVLASSGGLLVLLLGVALAPEPGSQPGGAEDARSLLAGGSVIAAWGIALLALTLEGWGEAWRGPVTGGLAVLSMLLALAPFAPRSSRVGWTAAAGITALAWPPIQFDGEWTLLAWSGLLLVGAILAFRYHLAPLRLANRGAAALLVGHWLGVEAPGLDAGELGWLPGLGFALAAVIATGVAWRASARDIGEQAPWTRLVLAGALVIAVAYPLAALEGFLVSLTWAGLALALVAAGMLASIQDLRLASLALFALVLARVFLLDMDELEVGVRIITFLVVGVILLAASFLYARQAGAQEEPSQDTR